MATLHVSPHEEIDVDDLKAKCDLRQIIPPHLERARPVDGGAYWVGCCPFHEDKNPSFLVFRDGYRCMSESCQEYGSVVDWYAAANPLLEWWDLLRLIDSDCGVAFPVASAKKVKVEVHQKEPLPEPMSLADADIKYQIEYPSDDIIDWIHDKWLLSRQTVEKERIAYSQAYKAIVIPVWGFNGELITIRFRNHDNPKMGKYWGIQGRNGVYGYGRQWVQDAEYGIVVMGEMTACFLHHEWGFASFSWTNGCRSFKPYLKPLLAHLKGGVVVPDVSEDDAAGMVAHLLGSEWKVALLEMVGGKDGEDVIDWAKREGSREEFCDLILNKSVELDNGILSYWGSRLKTEWRR